MEHVSSESWFLRKHQDGSIFGPISFDQLSGWASAAQVAPHDVVSTDQQTWLKARWCRSSEWIGWSKSRASITTVPPPSALFRNLFALAISTQTPSSLIHAMERVGKSG